MVRSKLLAAVACLVAPACAQELTMQQRAVEQRVVQDRLDTWVRALNNRRLDTLAASYAHVPQLTVVWPEGRRTRGWEQEEQAQRDFFASVSYMNFVVQESEVEVLTPTVALTTFRTSIDIMQGGTRRPVVAGQGTVVWRKDRTDQQWKIWSAHLSQNVPPPPAPAARTPARRR